MSDTYDHLVLVSTGKRRSCNKIRLVMSDLQAISRKMSLKADS